MITIRRTIQRLDQWQQNHRAAAFTFAVFKKFADDQAGNQVELLTYFAFLATFPLLLALVGTLGIVLHSDPALSSESSTHRLASSR
jgi:uncharacterized BrkB/YihY/UPF0761 family membrane protein